MEIDNRFKAIKKLTHQGGMGSVYLMSDLCNEGRQCVLKFCDRTDNEESVKRFKREVRLLELFAGNSKVVQILHQNLDHEPPYFAMEYYPEGNLKNKAGEIAADHRTQEHWFCQIIDCISELHHKDIYHRDIKPENFLILNNSCVAADFGLGAELNSTTAFTSQGTSWGTIGYIPPEFYDAGGFMNADERSDIYMIGKTFYHLLTNRNPTHLNGDGIPKPLYYLIDKCCKVDPHHRFDNLSSLKQRLTQVYDVLLNRRDGLGKCTQLINEIKDAATSSNEYNPSIINHLIETLSGISNDEKDQVIMRLPKIIFSVIGINGKDNPHEAERFLTEYEECLDRQINLDFSHAEIIADEMSAFLSTVENPSLKAKAFIIAVKWADALNRYAAMDTCKSILYKIEDNDFAFQVIDFIQNNPNTFLSRVQGVNCRNSFLRQHLPVQ